jgi:iron-sulfur cluster repair protein YtfE (RIC family)
VSISGPPARRLVKENTMTSQQAPTLLNDDGSASMATALLMSHHGLRRDLARLAIALGQPAASEPARAAALKEEWQGYHGKLHGHHEAEDNGFFPGLRSGHAHLAPVIDRLTSDHRRIDPLLEAGDRAFADLATTREAAAKAVTELGVLLHEHLALEEAEVISFLRDAREFPPPGTDAEAEMYAQGFAWACHGVAEDVLARLYAMLPPSLTSRLPAARVAFDARCARVWGPTKPGASRTAVPDWLAGG